MHRFRDMTTYWPKIAQKTYATLFGTLLWSDLLRIFRRLMRSVVPSAFIPGQIGPFDRSVYVFKWIWCGDATWSHCRENIWSADVFGPFIADRHSSKLAAARWLAERSCDSPAPLHCSSKVTILGFYRCRGYTGSNTISLQFSTHCDCDNDRQPEIGI